MSFDISKVHDFNRISNLSNPYKLNKNAEKYNQNTRIFKEIWDDVHDIPNGENGQSVLLSKRKRKKEDEALAVEPVLKKMGPGEPLFLPDPSIISHPSEPQALFFVLEPATLENRSSKETLQPPVDVREKHVLLDQMCWDFLSTEPDSDLDLDFFPTTSPSNEQTSPQLLVSDLLEREPQPLDEYTNEIQEILKLLLEPKDYHKAKSKAEKFFYIIEVLHKNLKEILESNRRNRTSAVDIQQKIIKQRLKAIKLMSKEQLKLVLSEESFEALKILCREIKQLTPRVAKKKP